MVLSAILLTCLQASAFEGATNSAMSNEDLPRGYRELATTKATTLDLEDNGSTRVERKYDKSGQLTELTYFDYSVQPPLVERLLLSKGDGTYFEVRTRTTERGKLLVRKEIERYQQPGHLGEREIIWSSQGDGRLDRRTVMHYVNLIIEVSEFELAGKDWKLKNSSRHSAIQTKAIERYVDCLQGVSTPAQEASCRSFLESLPLSPLVIEDLDAGRFVTLECRKDQEYFLPNGFVIDLKSCGDRDVARLREATNLMMTKRLGCVHKLNPNLARKLALTVSTDRPRAKCSGLSSGLTSGGFCLDPADSDSDACRQTIEQFRRKAFAFHWAAEPHSAFYNEISASAVLHETLHMAGEDEDVAAGCEAACDPEAVRTDLTREQCVVCLQAEGNVPDPAALAHCSR